MSAWGGRVLPAFELGNETLIHVHRNQMVPKTEGKKTTTEKKALFSCKCPYLISMFQREIEAKRWQMLRYWLNKASRSPSEIVASPRSVAVVSCDNYTKQRKKATFHSQGIKVANLFENVHTKIEKNLGRMI